MLQVDATAASDYRLAWEAWQRQVARLHGVLLDSEPIEPAAFKGLLNREARAWETYSAARRRLLGLGEPALPADPDANPFR